MKAISIDVGIESSYVMIAVNGYVTHSIQFPNDYTVKDIASIIYNECSNHAIETKIICDKHGIGMGFWDNFTSLEMKCGELNNITKIDSTLFTSENQVKIAKFISDKTYMRKIYKLCKDCKSLFSDFECDKLIDDIGKLKYETRETGRITIKTNDCINEERVFCLLQLIALDDICS